MKQTSYKAVDEQKLASIAWLQQQKVALKYGFSIQLSYKLNTIVKRKSEERSINPTTKPAKAVRPFTLTSIINTFTY
ncbi:hypothetical protein [uncultured Pontibacter sp.]|uniref:hypothetical protein n=1 Tax=uncultured Pontibacter sp. TaxID=453356 RepID=UPI0026298DAC|nr:hypothetical protein [uncultured Pontibacter sp.]